MQIEKLGEKIGGAQIVFACQTGSKVFCDNNNDADYLVVLSNWDKDFSSVNIDGEDYYLYSTSQFEKMATLQSGKYYDIYAIALLLGEPIYGTNPISGYNWFDYKKRAVNAVLRYGEVNYFSPFVKARNANKENVCPKSMCWALATYFAITNNSKTFIAEQKAVLQQCHNLQLPRTYAVTLEQQVKALHGALQ